MTKLYNNPFSDCFSISSEMLIHFEVSLFTDLVLLSDNRRNEVRRASLYTHNLATEKQKCRQNDKP